MKRIHQLILSAILLLGSIVFGTVGLVHWRHDISENADINDDQVVDVTDVMLTVNIILNGGTSN